ncbi:alpha-amylase family glycosyl hydrolase [Streptomyces sp. NPDC060020]|uniref:alpha-amylase family glycosyl hydrolase n=1 Tax=Streptomyces sp. NPDC060020 TaxID=3347038 RepID=UPI00369411C6
MTHESTAVQLASSSSNATASGGWWRDAVIYQVYVRSFADSDGDGVGDLRGVRSRLPHLARLGVDAVWLTPFYVSPQADGGYDVADYRAVDPLFGDLSDADELVRAAHALGLRVIVDVVPNHTSVQHPWFRAALAGDAEARARYLFRPGRGADGSEPPNDWESIFGGPAWTRVADGAWYLHLFAPEQPDLDWDHPEVAAEFASVLRFWLDLGVDGFRVDVAHGMVKAPGLPDIGRGAQATLIGTEPLPFFDQDGVHEIHRGWRRLLDSYEGDRIGVAEAWAPTSERLALYVRPDELHQAFNFRFLNCPWDPDAMRTVIDESLAATTSVGAPTTWVLSNHDVVRHVTRYGGGARGLARARAAALLMLALPGSAYLYQGEELGLPEVLDLPDESRRDPAFRRGRRQQIPGTAPHPAPAGTATATATHAATSRTGSVSAPVPEAGSETAAGTAPQSLPRTARPHPAPDTGPHAQVAAAPQTGPGTNAQTGTSTEPQPARGTRPEAEGRTRPGAPSQAEAGTGPGAASAAPARPGPTAPAHASTSRTASVSAPVPQAQPPAGPGTEPLGQAGPGAGVGTGPGTNPQPGTGTGPQARPQTGAGARPKADGQARPGTTAQAEPATGPQAAMGTRPEAGGQTGPGTTAQAEPASGPQARTATGPQAETGTGPQAGTEAEGQTGPGPNPQAGTGSRPQAEPAGGPQAETGSGPQAGAGAGPGADPQAGPEAARQAGPEAEGQEGLRDGCRVPIPWCGAEPPYGFGPTGSWLPQPAGWGGLTVAAQTGDPHSTLELYRAALELRRALPGLGAPEAGTGAAAEAPYRSGMCWLPAPEGVLLFTRPGFACTLNSRPDPVELPAPGRPVLSSAPVETDGRTVRLPPDSCTWWAI